MSAGPVLRATQLWLDAPGGRPLLRDLEICIECGERVALVGRNGVGKSSLLEVLAGADEPRRGRVLRSGRTLLVRQDLRGSDAVTLSPGERRRRALEDACRQRPELLLLDEPTRDLDSAGVAWLVDELRASRAALVVVTHDRRLLRHFRQFFVIAEAGCRAFAGSFDELLRDMERHDAEGALRYARHLSRLLDQEQHTARVRSRRERKKNVGRIRELGRCPARIRLNGKRSYKQVSQGTRAVLQRDRISRMREWVQATRRALSVTLPLTAVLPVLPEESDEPLVIARGVSARAGSRVLFAGIDLKLRRERVAVTGPNGSGKTTLLNIILQERRPESGRVVSALERIGNISQNAANWCSRESLLEQLVTGSHAVTLERAAELLVSHEFPLALAERPLRSLSPGERVRAALISLFQRRPAVELLVLDEPTDDLDLQATLALEALLRAWPGGLLVASHDAEFLRGIGLQQQIQLTGNGWCLRPSAPRGRAT